MDDREKSFVCVSDQGYVQHPPRDEVGCELLSPENSSGRSEHDGAPEDPDVFEFLLHAEPAEGGAFFETNQDATMLGISVIIFALLVWLVVLLITDPKGVLKKILEK